jgi:asparagine synthase (glutamine-hydrolysing)
MSGIAGILLPRGARPQSGVDRLAGMERALNGADVGAPLILDEGRLALVARGAPGYVTGLRLRRAGTAVLALAYHGLPLSANGGAGISARIWSPAGSDPPELADDPLREILDALESRGESALAEFRGEFALAFFDGRDRSLHLAVDRFRVQSLLVAERPNQILFGSRMAALLASPIPFRPSVDPSSLLDVVSSSIIATPGTIFREVVKVPPGHSVRVRDGRSHTHAYWDIDFRRADGEGPKPLMDRTRAALESAVDDRFEADRSQGAGAFLSGGVDSSTVAGLLTRVRGSSIPTFSIGFGEELFDELRYARIASAAFGTRQIEYRVTPRDVESAMEPLAEGFDEPFGNASAIPTYCCARLAREHGMDVLYAGDGGDELFAGNERYATSRIFERYGRVPALLRKPFLTPAITAAGTLLPWSLFVKAKKYVLRASLPAAERVVSYGFWNVVPPREFVDGDLIAAASTYQPSAMALCHHRHARAKTELDRQLYLDLKITISDNDLFKVTRMCDQAGVAVRFPFLDERVVDAAECVPASMKMRRGELRTFFKEAFRDLLPAEIRAKKKHGFGLPISGWLRTDPRLHAMMRDLVLSERSLRRGYFRRAALEDLVRRHAEDPTPYYGTVLWNLMSIELWHRRVLDDTAIAPEVAPGEVRA